MLQIYAVSITIRIVVSAKKFNLLENVYFFSILIYMVHTIHVIYSSFCQFGFMFIALIWKFDFAPFMVLIIAILNDGEKFFY